MPKMVISRFLLLATGLLACTPAWAHQSEAHEPMGWTFDPWILTPIALLGALYAAGLFRLSRRSGVARLTSPASIAFWCGWLSLIVALVSPLHQWGEHMFTAHMIEHEILMAVSAPLLALSRPIGPIVWGLPIKWRHGLSRLVNRPAVQNGWNCLSSAAVATVLHAVAIWVWHHPLLFDATVDHVSLHRLQHWSFFLSALLFWWSMIWRTDYGIAAFDLLLTMLHTAILGALIALTPHITYVKQTRDAVAWGLTSLEDQQLAGIVMWIPAGIVYAGVALFMLALWINRSGKGGPHAVRTKLS